MVPFRRSGGMTLVEVLLVLALLVITAAVAWPALDRPLANNRLRKAADVVRIEWGRMRTKAIATGATGVFRFAPDTDRYVVERHAGPEYVDDTSETAESEEQPAGVLGSQERTLPEDTAFVSGESAADARAALLDLGTDHLSPTDQGWSDPIQFYPDGTTSTATVVLKNKFGRTIELSLRGLTGVVTIGKVQSGEEEL